MWRDFPSDEQIRPKRRRRDLALPEPTQKYVIFFTPRSGSSWLTRALERTEEFGKPGELFNPAYLPTLLRRTSAQSLEQYLAVISRRRAVSDTFGFEITFHQAHAVFSGYDAFHRAFPDFKAIWLVRRDIVAQAVSLYKMEAHNVAHSLNTTDEQVRAADDRFGYDAEQVRNKVEHILQAETETEAYFERHAIEPLRLSYEDNMAAGARAVTTRIGAFIGLDRVTQDASSDNPHKKIGTGVNEDFATRFREEEAAFVKEVEAQRSTTLAGLGS